MKPPEHAKCAYPIKTIALLLVTTTAVWTGCTGTEIGNPATNSKPTGNNTNNDPSVDSEVRIDITAYDSSHSALSVNDSITLDKIWVAFESIRLRNAPDCDGGDELDWEVPFAAEIVAGVETPETPVLFRKGTDYCRLEYRLASLDGDTLPESIPPDLQESTLYIRGSRADGTPFEIRDDKNFKIRMNGPFSIASEKERLFIAFDVGSWLTGDMLDDLSGAPEITIDSDTNVNVLIAFRNNFRRSTRLFRDEDGDGNLRAAERSQPLTEASEEEDGEDMGGEED
jgi:hypothetical protein